jgi:hypothetical protein
MNKSSKTSMIKNWVIFILVALIIVLLWSNWLDPDTKEKFYWFAGVVVVIVAIVYLFSHKQKFDLFKVCQEIKDKEYRFTSHQVSITHMQADIVNSNIIAIYFDTAGHLVLYLYDTVNMYITGRLIKRLDAVKDEHNQREINRAMALAMIKQEQSAKINSEQGEDVEGVEE